MCLVGSKREADEDGMSVEMPTSTHGSTPLSTASEKRQKQKWGLQASPYRIEEGNNPQENNQLSKQPQSTFTLPALLPEQALSRVLAQGHFLPPF